MQPNLGPAGMKGVGPGATLHKKSFDQLQTEVDKLVTYLKKNTKPDKPSLEGFITHLKALKKNVDQYVEHVPAAASLQTSYTTLLHDLQAAVTDFNNEKTRGGHILKINTELRKITAAQYIAPPKPPDRPTTPAPSTKPTGI